MYLIDSLLNAKTCIDNKWVIARPIPNTNIKYRIKSAWSVFTGKCDAIKFYKQ